MVINKQSEERTSSRDTHSRVGQAGNQWQRIEVGVGVFEGLDQRVLHAATGHGCWLTRNSSIDDATDAEYLRMENGTTPREKE